MKKITAAEADRIMKDNARDPNYIMVDVRTPEEFSDGHIRNAVNIDYRAKGFRDNIAKLDRNRTYLVYCRSGHRSGEAVKIMKQLGFKRIYDLGGIIDWKKAGLPVVK